jgi:hypothetical protein
MTATTFTNAPPPALISSSEGAQFLQLSRRAWQALKKHPAFPLPVIGSHHNKGWYSAADLRGFSEYLSNNSADIRAFLAGEKP